MEMPLFGVLVTVFIIGAVASGVSQFATAGKGLEVAARAISLRRNLESLRERNGRRRNTLDKRQDILDEYRRKSIEPGEGQLNADALKEAIDREVARTEDLRKSILDSEKIITEYDSRLSELEVQKVRSNTVLLIISVVVGGVTALIFGFINFLSSGESVSSISSPVAITSSVIVQSLALGAGWPLVWERFLSTEKLESAVNAAAEFNVKVGSAEEKEV